MPAKVPELQINNPDMEKADRKAKWDKSENNELELLQYLSERYPEISWDDYEASREFMIGHKGVPESYLPPPARIKERAGELGMKPDEYFGRRRKNDLAAIHNRLNFGGYPAESDSGITMPDLTKTWPPSMRRAMKRLERLSNAPRPKVDDWRLGEPPDGRTVY